MNFKVTIQTDKGEKTIECPADKTILDAADEAGMDLPFSCRSGTCSSCAGKVLKGTVSQDDQQMLDEAQIKKGFALLCVSYPTSDCTIKGHAEGELY